MASKTKRQTKGVFSSATQLPVSPRYLWPGTRRWTLLAGLAGCGIVAIVLLLAGLGRGRAVLSPGPVSSSHANFERNCAACHTGASMAVSSGCRVCHEKVGDTQGTYSFAAHYAYRSPGRKAKADPEREQPCAACHPDHRGRETAITAVLDARCLGCHAFGSFNEEHPEFQFARERLPDDPHLNFAHGPHVKRVREAKGFADPQLACLTCHEPDQQGAGFGPIQFDRHCDACHLTGSDETPRLPVGDPGNPAAPGVETLAAIQARAGPGARWAFFTNPEEFRQGGGKVSKSPLFHEDPWVMENLRRIRRTLYPGTGIAELLKTSVAHGAVGASDETLAREAVATLREQLMALRGRPEPEIQEELRQLDALLAAAEAKIEKGEPLPAGLFAAAGGLNPKLTGEQAATLKQLALDLTEPCRKCHLVSDAAILRVQTDQRTLVRAELNHRVHLLQRPFCLDCHGAIPVLDGKPTLEQERLDISKVQNLPTIAVCRECHTPAEASNQCVTCHLFHPGKGRHADLVVYRRPKEGT